MNRPNLLLDVYLTSGFCWLLVRCCRDAVRIGVCGGVSIRDCGFRGRCDEVDEGVGGAFSNGDMVFVLVNNKKIQ